MREKIEYSLVKCFLSLAKIVPKSFIYTMMKGLVFLVYHLDQKRRDLTIRNLTMAFPEKSTEDIILLSKDVYKELSKTIAEILLMFVERFDIDEAVMNKDEIIEKLDWLSKNSPQGVVSLTAHFSNWELLAQFSAKHGFPMLVVGREGNNHLIEENITIPFRKKHGNETISKKKAMLSMAKKLRNGGNIGILIDQRAGNKNSVSVDFFHESAKTTTSIALLKLKFDPKIIPCFAVRRADGKYEILMDDPVEYRAEEEENEEKKLEKMTEKYNQVIETIIRKYPAQWFWMHDRWRI